MRIVLYSLTSILLLLSSTGFAQSSKRGSLNGYWCGLKDSSRDTSWAKKGVDFPDQAAFAINLERNSLNIARANIWWDVLDPSSRIEEERVSSSSNSVASLFENKKIFGTYDGRLLIDYKDTYKFVLTGANTATYEVSNEMYEPGYDGDPPRRDSFGGVPARLNRCAPAEFDRISGAWKIAGQQYGQLQASRIRWAGDFRSRMSQIASEREAGLLKLNRSLANPNFGFQVPGVTSPAPTTSTASQKAQGQAPVNSSTDPPSRSGQGVSNVPGQESWCYRKSISQGRTGHDFIEDNGDIHTCSMQ